MARNSMFKVNRANISASGNDSAVTVTNSRVSIDSSLARTDGFGSREQGLGDHLDHVAYLHDFE